MIFSPNKYGRILPFNEEEEMVDISDGINRINTINHHKGGVKELWQRFKDFLGYIKMKASKAFGLADGITIKSCLNRLASLAQVVADKIRSFGRDYAGPFKRILDTISNAIMDLIEYIKREFT